MAWVQRESRTRRVRPGEVVTTLAVAQGWDPWSFEVRSLATLMDVMLDDRMMRGRR